MNRTHIASPGQFGINLQELARVGHTRQRDRTARIRSGLLQTARTTISCNTRKVNNNKKKEENPNSVQSSEALRSCPFKNPIRLNSKKSLSLIEPAQEISLRIPRSIMAASSLFSRTNTGLTPEQIHFKNVNADYPIHIVRRDPDWTYQFTTVSLCGPLLKYLNCSMILTQQ